MKEALEKIRDDLRGELLSFGRVISANMFSSPTPPFHYEIEETIISKKDRKLLIKAPRDTAKSSIIAGILPLYRAVYDSGNKYCVVQSKTLGEAKKRLRKIKNILEFGNEFIDLYGYWGEQKAITWTEEKVIVRGFNPVNQVDEEWVFEAKGTGQQMRGLKEDDTRVTLYIIDDPEDEENTKTKESMDSNFDKFLVALPGVSLDGQVVVIGTPIHQLCMIERIMKMTGWVKLWYKTIDDETKTSIWEDRLPYKEILLEKESLKSAGRLSKWYSERQCEITGDEDQLFREDDLRYYDGWVEHIQGENYLHIKSLNSKLLTEEILKPVNIFIGIDPASSTRQGADMSVTFPIAYDEDRNVYVLPYFRKRTNPMDHANNIVEMVQKYKPKRAHVETTGYQEMLRSYLREKLGEKGLYVGGLELKFNPRTEKSKRLEDLQPLVASNRLYIKEGMQELIGEFIMYPRSSHDDLLDGLYYSTRRLYEPDHIKPDEEDDLRHYPMVHYQGNWMTA